MLVGRATMEVLPKLTLALVCPRAWLAVDRPRTGFFSQIDNWLFSKMFLPVLAEQPGLARPESPGAVEWPLELDQTVVREAERIGALGKGDRHEAIGAFVAGFQGALALAGQACVVGTEDAHFLLPKTWHSDWDAAWESTTRSGEATTRRGVSVMALSSHETDYSTDLLGDASSDAQELNLVSESSANRRQTP